MYRNPYKTVLQTGDTRPLIKELTHLVVANTDINFGLNILIPDSKIIPIAILGRPEEGDIEVFRHPVFFEYDGITYCAYDFRHLVKFKEGIDDIRTMSRNKDILNVDLARFILSIRYYENESMLSPVSTITAKAMTNWLARLLQNNLSLTVVETMSVETVIAYYFNYITLDHSSTDEEELHLITLDRVYAHLGPNSKNFVTDVFEGIDTPTDISKLSDILSTVNQKLKGMNGTALLSIVNKTVIVPNAIFTISSALEHPPTMLVVLDAAISQKINSRSRLNMTIGRMKEIETISEFVERMKSHSFI